MEKFVDSWQSLFLLAKEQVHPDGRVKHNVEIDPRDVINLITQVRLLNKKLNTRTRTRIAK